MVMTHMPHTQLPHAVATTSQCSRSSFQARGDRYPEETRVDRSPHRPCRLSNTFLITDMFCRLSISALGVSFSPSKHFPLNYRTIRSSSLVVFFFPAPQLEDLLSIKRDMIVSGHDCWACCSQNMGEQNEVGGFG